MIRTLFLSFCLCILFVPSVLAVNFSLDADFLEFINQHSISVTDITEKEKLISSYCEKIFSSTSHGGGFYISGANEIFRSDQSLFTAALCHSYSNIVLSDTFSSVFKSDFSKTLALQQFDGSEELCFSAENRERCDLNRYTSRIFTVLMSDIFKIKWANFVGVRSVKLADKKERIDTLFSSYFAMDSDKLQSFQRDYPKTSAMIDNNQQHFVKSLQSLKILDSDKLSTKECTNESPLFICGLYAGKDWVDQQFLNFVYNEYLNYAIFVDFITTCLTKKAQQQTPEEAFATSTEVSALLQQKATYQQALEYALGDFKDFIATYPLHVGFVLYQEKLLQFRDNASKLLPPFYTLYEKLRNVQPLK